MAKQTGLGSALYVSGYDVGGDTRQFSCHGGPAALDMTDITQSGMARAGGLRDAGVNWDSYHDPAALAAHAVLSALTTADQIVTGMVGPLAIGCEAFSMSGKQIDYPPNRANTGELIFGVPDQAQGFGLEWGKALTAGRRVDGAATAAGAGNSYDTGLSLSFGAQMYVHLFAFTGTSVTIKVQDSADNITFLDIAGTSLTTTALTTPQQAVRVSIPNTTTVRRYIAVGTTGTFSNADFAVQVTKNVMSGVLF